METRGRFKGETMWCCDGTTFVLQRRINRPFVRIMRAISNPEIFGHDCVLASDGEGALRLDSRFHGSAMFSLPTLRANATLHSRRGRDIPIELEISEWAKAYDTELLLRPRARRPERWSGASMQRYFAHAHRSADALTLLLQHTVAIEESLSVFR
jgi:hypothetical protein